ncbi:metacaspase-3 isoform X1 [Coffea arabica]|uniref:Metacaspase-3 isoform X1 n=1 Tax=Coffea arabica TaxID=13443 RepID=A0A6P6VT69_COFAR|nr:metacaspase-1-like isoform X1 [Coffea arabica]XP_027106259.1 metacaspase-1-like isoform X1 [Coffea arabica]XP_027106260.1 metacaspase-1-like isoform X1 [Coffea arabica]
MDTVTCKTCHRISSATKHTTKIRCHGCQGTILIGNSQVSVPLDMSKWPSHDQDNIMTERKGFRYFCKKISGISPRSSPSFSQFPTARLSDTPPRGKRALLCGVSYNQNKKLKLRGTTPDVMNMAKLLVQQFGFPTNAILVLGGIADFTSYETPTRMNIIRAFDWLVKDSQSGDSLVFYFSGHGVRQLDHDGDEIDGFDEAICPLDFETAGIIIDNEINKMIVEPLKQGVTLHAIIDACHSGTVLDLPRVYDHNRGRWKDNYPASGAYKGTSGGKAICFSACEDYQQASDTSAFSPEMAGAMTFTFIKAVVENKEITYHGILDFMHNAIENANKSQRGCGMLNRMFYPKMLQDPMLSSSESFNVNSSFNL